MEGGLEGGLRGTLQQAFRILEGVRTTPRRGTGVGAVGAALLGVPRKKVVAFLRGTGAHDAGDGGGDGWVGGLRF